MAQTARTQVVPFREIIDRKQSVGNIDQERTEISIELWKSRSPIDLKLEDNHKFFTGVYATTSTEKFEVRSVKEKQN
jgi:hypothetical protein